MALPKLNDIPKYELTVPSSKTKVRFRPYLVKEEKILMLAMESEDKKATVNAIVDTIMACIEGDIDQSKLTSFDVEYMFLKLRSKSVGENTEVTIKCSECDADNPVSIDLSSIEVTKQTSNKEIKITDDMTLYMGYPNFKSIMDADADETTSDTIKTFQMISKCMKVLETADERYDLADESQDEIQEFIGSLSANQFDKVKEWIQTMPKLSETVNFNCLRCNHANEYTLEGLDDFF
ncbi:MAG: baseplate protein [Euryarchaeota archaeon]|nr:baseplate protein [Euryarchaeota archaeon]|tara:strand:+ start:2000 stop:2707 length:708 start_codon:yes stop_codon:yes gene_type:complete